MCIHQSAWINYKEFLPKNDDFDVVYLAQYLCVLSSSSWSLPFFQLLLPSPFLKWYLLIGACHLSTHTQNPLPTWWYQWKIHAVLKSYNLSLLHQINCLFHARVCICKTLAMVVWWVQWFRLLIWNWWAERAEKRKEHDGQKEKKTSEIEVFVCVCVPIGVITNWMALR